MVISGKSCSNKTLYVLCTRCRTMYIKRNLVISRKAVIIRHSTTYVLCSQCHTMYNKENLVVYRKAVIIRRSTSYVHDTAQYKIKKTWLFLVKAVVIIYLKPHIRHDHLKMTKSKLYKKWWNVKVLLNNRVFKVLFVIDYSYLCISKSTILNLLS